MKAASTFGSPRTPSSIIRAAPAPPSSAGWNISFTVPANCDRRSIRSCAAPNSIAVWASCPHACITPGISEAKGTPERSSIGNASMSARSRTHGPSPPSPLGHHTGLGEPGVERDAEVAEAGLDQYRRLLLLVRHLGMGVDGAAVGDNPRSERASRFQQPPRAHDQEL